MAEKPARVMFGNYQPDLADLVNNGLEVAKNTVPITGGYDGINALADLSTFTALAERPRGAIAGIDSEGNPYNFAGTETKLYALRNDTTDATRTSGAYSCKGDKFWEFGVHGKNIIGTQRGDVPQYYTLGAAQPFKDLGNPDTTGTVAPRAAHIGIVGSFVMLGNTIDAINGADPSAIHWSAQNDPFNWPAPGSAVARALLSGRQSLIGDGGAVQRIVTGNEVTSVFQERTIQRVEFIGGSEVFQIDPVEPNRGLLIPAICVPFGRNIFYLSEDGFYVFDSTQSESIGREIIDQTFLADVDTEFFGRVSATRDPDSQRIWVLYPGSGNSAGVPNKYIVYDWGLNRFSHGEIDAEWITQVVDAGVTLDSPGVIGDPDTTTDDPDYPEGGIDGVSVSTGIPLPSFDARITAPGGLKLGAYSTTFKLQDFSGSGMAATLETGNRELIPGSRSLATRAQIMVNGVNPTLQASGLRRTNATARFSKETRVDEDGDAPLLVDGRFHKFRVNLPSGFSKALHMDVNHQLSGMY